MVHASNLLTMFHVLQLIQGIHLAFLYYLCDNNYKKHGVDNVYNRRRIPLTGTENTRDLGGYPLNLSHIMRYGVFLRSGVPTGLSPDDEALLRQMNITTIIDLRGDDELNRTPCYFADRIGFSYHHLPISGGDFMRDGEEKIGTSYFYMTKCPSMIKIFKILSNMNGGCLYHCTAGKDRTGVISAILQLLAGMEEADVIVDYSMSQLYLAKLLERLKSDFVDLPAYLGNSSPEYIMDFLGRFHEAYGSAQAYLEDIGLTDGEINALRNKLICPLGTI